MEEIWKPINGYEGLYEVSNLGRVKSLSKLCGRSSRKDKLLKPCKNKGGYLSVILWKDGKIKKFLIHRLVAIAFLENSNNKPCINHIDCNPSNNCIDNLEWCTYSENTQYAYKLGRMNRRKTPIIAINLTTKEEIYLNSQQEAARQLNLYEPNINNVLKGKCKRAGNYTFKYIDEKQQEDTLLK